MIRGNGSGRHLLFGGGHTWGAPAAPPTAASGAARGGGVSARLPCGRGPADGACGVGTSRWCRVHDGAVHLHLGGVRDRADGGRHCGVLVAVREGVILCLIQIGGFGIMTLSSFVVLLLGGQLGLRQRLIAAAKTRWSRIGDVRRLLVGVAKLGLGVEAIAAVMLCLRFWIGRDEQFRTRRLPRRLPCGLGVQQCRVRACSPTTWSGSNAIRWCCS